jgi:ABC-type multidrug transport system ATPase subunit
MKQKLGLALALLSDPPILILDEPTANLDTYTRKSFLLQILKLKKNGKTLIFASHRTSDILNLADRVLVLENGRIIDECHPAQIKLQNTSKVTMYIYPLKNQLEKASSLLQNQGFEINCRDSGISVSILSEEAIKLLSILIKGGINITDFDLKKAE